MPAYHDVFWLAAALTSVLLMLGVIGLSLAGERQPAPESSLTAVLVLALGVMFTLAMSCLGLRRDFIRPLIGVVAMAVLFMGVLALLSIRLGGKATDQPDAEGV